MTRAPGRSSRTRATRAAGSASPAKTTASARISPPTWSRSSAKTDGTALTTPPLQPPRSPMTRTSRTTSRVPPTAKVVTVSKTETSKLTEVPARVRVPASMPTVSARRSTPLTTSRWVIVTPFGTPVEPEVYITYAAFAGRGATSGTRGPATAKSMSSTHRAGTSVVGSTPAVSAPVRISCGRASAKMCPRRALGYLGSTGR